MVHRIFVGCVFGTMLSFIFQSSAHSVPSKWEKVETSLTELLNSGWQIMGMSSNRAAYQNSFGSGGLDEQTYSFFMINKGKYIVCIAPNPAPPVTNIGCRRLN